MYIRQCKFCQSLTGWVQAKEVYGAEGQFGDSLKGSGLSMEEMEALTGFWKAEFTLINGLSLICRERTRNNINGCNKKCCERKMQYMAKKPAK